MYKKLENSSLKYYFFRITSTPSVSTNGNVNGSTNQSNGVYSSDQSINYDKLKQELITEFRKELQTFKQDIVNSNLKNNYLNLYKIN